MNLECEISADEVNAEDLTSAVLLDQEFYEKEEKIKHLCWALENNDNFFDASDDWMEHTLISIGFEKQNVKKRGKPLFSKFPVIFTGSQGTGSPKHYVGEQDAGGDLAAPDLPAPNGSLAPLPIPAKGFDLEEREVGNRDGLFERRDVLQGLGMSTVRTADMDRGRLEQRRNPGFSIHSLPPPPTEEALRKGHLSEVVESADSVDRSEPKRKSSKSQVLGFPPQNSQQLLMMTKDQQSARFLQQKLEAASDGQRHSVFLLVIPHASSLSIDPFGNYVMQKLFEVGNQEQRRILTEQFVGDVLRLSLHPYGCRVVQKALEQAGPDQQMLLVGELKTQFLKLMEDQHGNHVAQKVIEMLPSDKLQFILDILKMKVPTMEGSFDKKLDFLEKERLSRLHLASTAVQRLSCHVFGCRVMQRLLENCTHGQMAPILEELGGSIMNLVTDQFGNYVIQHVLVYGREADRTLVFKTLKDNFLTFACHKFASNVIERVLLHGPGRSLPRQAEIVQLIECALGSPLLPRGSLGAQIGEGDVSDPNPPLYTLMRDRYGNYIVQKMLEAAKGEAREALVWRLREQVHVLKKFTYERDEEETAKEDMEERKSKLAKVNPLSPSLPQGPVQPPTAAASQAASQPPASFPSFPGCNIPLPPPGPLIPAYFGVPPPPGSIPLPHLTAALGGAPNLFKGRKNTVEAEVSRPVKLSIRNLPLGCGEEMLRRIFMPFGLVEVQMEGVAKDPTTDESALKKNETLQERTEEVNGDVEAPSAGPQASLGSATVVLTSSDLCDDAIRTIHNKVLVMPKTPSDFAVLRQPSRKEGGEEEIPLKLKSHGPESLPHPSSVPPSLSLEQPWATASSLQAESQYWAPPCSGLSYPGPPERGNLYSGFQPFAMPQPQALVYDPPLPQLLQAEAQFGSARQPVYYPSVAGGCKVFVGSIPSETTENQLTQLFSQWYPLLEVHIMARRGDRTGDACAFVIFENSRDAGRAIASLNGAQVAMPGSGGRMVSFPLASLSAWRGPSPLLLALN